MHTVQFKILPRLTIITMLLTLMVIGLGAYTRLSDAGLGCPDWPGCYGKINAPTTQAAINEAYATYQIAHIDPVKAHIEMVHRYFAGLLGLLIFLIAILHLKYNTVKSKIPLLLILLTIIQAGFGMWTVTLKLLPIIVLIHLIGGLSILGALSFFYMQLKHPLPTRTNMMSPNTKHIYCLALITLFIISIQIILGGMVSSNYAALACYDFPYCQGKLFPELDFSQIFNFLAPLNLEHPHQYLENASRITIHMLHRFGAICSSIILLTLIYTTIKKHPSQKLKLLSYKLLILLILQISLGIANILYFLPLWIAVLHNIIAALLLVTTIAFIFHVKNYG